MEKPNKSCVAISGANGFVGKNLRRLFNKKGINLVSITRRNFQNYKLETKIISPNLSKNIPISKLKKCHAFIHLIGTGKQNTTTDYEYVNVDLTKNAITLCRKAKIKKFIFISGLGVSKNTTSTYFISKYKAEQLIINSGLNYTILRASYIIDKNDPLSISLTRQIKNGTIIIPGSGTYHLQPISVNDVAEVIYRALISKKFLNKVIDLVGPQTVTFEKYVKIFKNKKSARIKKIKLENAYYNALHNQKSVFGVEDLNILVGDFIGNHKKLQKLSKMKFKTYLEVLQSRSTS
ncbi:MAG: SDR family oxidoreductase [Nitrosopumilaceae archaeon]